ncbi:MAG: hypothetical protein ACFE9V_03890 [Candidatus Hodarchaeota archaeon]
MCNYKSSIIRTIEKLYSTNKCWAFIVKLKSELDDFYKKMMVVRGQT